MEARIYLDSVNFMIRTFYGSSGFPIVTLNIKLNKAIILINY